MERLWPIALLAAIVALIIYLSQKLKGRKGDGSDGGGFVFDGSSNSSSDCDSGGGDGGGDGGGGD